MIQVVKSGKAQLIDEGTLPFWKALGWGLDADQDGVADSSVAATGAVPTLVKSAPYTATANDVVLADATGRSVTDAVTNGTTTLTSATAVFTTDDVGRVVSATNIPIGTTIASRTSATSVVLSAAATGSASSVNVSIYGTAPITLPASAPAGTVVEVKKVDATPNPVSVLAAGSDDIDGVASVTINARNVTRTFRKGTGTTWVAAGGLNPVIGPASLRYDRQTNVYLPSDTCLANLKAAIGRARMGGRPARALYRGDSTTLGILGGSGLYTANNPASLTKSQDINGVDRARKMLNASQALGGSVTESNVQATVGGTDTRWTFGTGWANTPIDAASTATGNLSYADDSQSNAFDVVLLRKGNATSIGIDIDGGSVTTVDLTTTTNNTAMTVRVTTGAVGTHTLNVHPPASGTVAVLAAEPINTTAMPVLKLARYGISGQTLASVAPASTGAGTNMQGLLGLSPDAAHLHMGINDMHFWTSGNGTIAAGVAAYKTNLIGWATAFRAINADPIFTIWPSRGYAAQSPGDFEGLPWQQAIYEVADAYDCAVLDLQRRWGYGFASIYSTATRMPMYDGTHPTLAGYSDHARMLHNFYASL